MAQHSKTSFAMRISGSQFAAIIALFFLPFLTVSCNGGGGGPAMEMIRVNGIDMVTGAVIETPSFKQGSGPERTRVDQELAALIAMAAAAAGAICGLLLGRFGRQLCIAFGIAGAVALIFLKQKIEGDILESAMKEGGPDAAMMMSMISINWSFAFWISVALFLSATATAVIATYQARSAPAVGP